jgi:TBC1 domain family member 4
MISLAMKQKRNSKELRALWKFAGRQIIILMRMERENVRLQERQNEHEIRRLKLNYEEIVPCDFELVEIWDELMTCQDNRKLLHAIRRGVPKQKRGDIWIMLAQQFTNKHPNIVDSEKFPNFSVPYSELLRRLTEHQHAIFIDIGRTFPRHEFYKSAFGMGQLSLFNLLKAYSIIDPEMGYCQGLAFICGILLLHVSMHFN